MKNITAVILAAGLGTRMKSSLPKVMHEVGGVSLLERVINTLKETGISDIVVVVGHSAELVQRTFKGKARFVRQDELLGSGDALKRVVNSLTDIRDEVLVACGDAPFISKETYAGLIDTHSREQASCTLLACTIENPLSYGRIVRSEQGDPVQIVEEKDLLEGQRNIKEVNTGAYCFNSTDLKQFINEIKENKKKREYYLTDIVGIINGHKKKIASAICPQEEMIGINTREDLASAHKIMYTKKIEQIMGEGVTVVDPNTTFINEDAKIGKDTIIYPGTVIEKDVEIKENCKIGPFARIRPGSRINANCEIGNFTEINRTVIGEGTKVKHKAYLGDAKIGKNVNIGAGAITANYDAGKKWNTIIEDDAFIGVGAILIAPVKIGSGAKVGAGSVVTKNKDVRPGETVAGVPAKPLGIKKK